MAPRFPTPRGPLTDALRSHLIDDGPLLPRVPASIDVLVDDDVQLALWCCYQLHYQGFADVPDEAEWDLQTLAFRADLEARFEAALRDEHAVAALPADPTLALRILATRSGPPLAKTIEQSGTLDHLREFAIHRSSYQLKEADPHTWAIPRLHGRGRSAMIEIQADEYGEGRPGQAHAEIFAAALRDLGLDDRFGHYVDRLPGVTLATDNLVSMFGLHRRLRGALIGHLALFEMCSVTPMTRYLHAARRLGGLPNLERFYEVHVEADVHHARLALDEMVGSFAHDEPELGPDIIFGASALQRVETRLARHLLSSWDGGRSSLRPALGPPTEVPPSGPDERPDPRGRTLLLTGATTPA